MKEAIKHQVELIQQLIQQMDKHFEQVDQRFVELQRRIYRFMLWSLNMNLTAGGIIIAVLKF